MSDFLDRVATRAVGSEAMLSPRLPSLFEPAGRGSAAVVEESFQVPAAVPATHTAEPELPNAHRPEKPAVRTSAPVLALSPRPAQDAPMQATPHERVVVTDDVRPDVPRSSERESSTEPAAPRALPRTAQAQAGELQPIRETHILRERIMAPPLRDQRSGELVPPAQPVFAARPEPAPQAARASRTGRPAETPRESREPVVHVSIGRLEVRAAATGTPAPRRQEAPRPSALDDYLRQRGGPSS